MNSCLSFHLRHREFEVYPFPIPRNFPIMTMEVSLPLCFML